MTWWCNHGILSQCIQGCELCVHWDNCVQKCKQFCEQLNRNTLPTGETNTSFSSGRSDSPFSLNAEKGNCTKTFVLRVLAHAGNFHNSDSNTVRSLNVSGQWSREFQPLCFPYLDSPDSQSLVLGYSHWKNKEQRGRRLTVTLVRVLWECPG